MVILKILLLGSNHHNTSIAYQNFGLPQSILIDKVDSDFEIGHTSRQEFSSDEELEIVLRKADSIYWTFPQSTEFDSLETYYQYLQWIKHYHSKYKNIANIGDICLDPYQWNPSVPKVTEDDAVFFGCSFTAGVGLSNPHTRWANKVAHVLGKNCKNLGIAGGSNWAAFNLISSMEFVPGQVVVWQITLPQRIQYCDKNKKIKDYRLTESHIKNHSSMLDVFTPEFMQYDLLTKIKFFVKLSRSLNLKMVFWLVDYKDLDLFPLDYQMYFYQYPEFIPSNKIQDYMVDVAEDNHHPGIKSNMIISDVVISHLNEVYQ